MLIRNSISLLSELVFAGERRVEKRRIVGIERDHQPLVEVALYGMLGSRLADASSQVAGDADLDRYLAISQFFDQVGILARGKSVADAFSVEVQRSPN